MDCFVRFRNFEKSYFFFCFLRAERFLNCFELINGWRKTTDVYYLIRDDPLLEYPSQGRMSNVMRGPAHNLMVLNTFSVSSIAKTSPLRGNLALTTTAIDLVVNALFSRFRETATVSRDRFFHPSSRSSPVYFSFTFDTPSTRPRFYSARTRISPRTIPRYFIGISRLREKYHERKNIKNETSSFEIFNIS